MLQTLFYIPHKIGPLPVFGWGWVLIAWGLFCLTVITYTARQQGFSQLVKHHLTTALLMTALIVFVFPWLEQRLATRGPNGNLLVGIPIRGYGLMLLVAIVSSVQLAIARAAKFRLDADTVYRLAMWLFVGGIIGARLFFVIQKWDQFPKGNFVAFLSSAVNVAEGGLVVYGSLIGATIAGVTFVSRHGLSIWKTADLVAPSLLLGLAIGRIGCLMNGCCYGGHCDQPWAIRFPPSSPPYEDQLHAGLLHGFQVADGRQTNKAHDAVIKRVIFVEPQSLAETNGLRVGQNIESINVDGTPGLLPASSEIFVKFENGHVAQWKVPSLPERSLPIHPTQVYATLNALVICLFLLAVTPYCGDGQVLAWLLTLYPITRFLLEMIRVDEGSFLNTGLTISQLISLILLAVAAALWLQIRTFAQLGRSEQPLPTGQ